MIGAEPIIGGPILALAGGDGGSVNPPQPSDPSSTYDWTVRVRFGGNDLTNLITGQLEVDREEGGAGVAGVVMYFEEGVAVVPTDWTGVALSIDFISTRAGSTSEARLFTGVLSQPDWDPVTRLMACAASDNLQLRVEAMGVEQIQALIPGYWSADVYEPTDGRSHWDYAQELLGSLPASLDCSAHGALRLTSWTPTAPAFEFGEGTTFYQSVRVELAEQEAITNFIEIEISYRYSRLREFSQTYGWTHPGTGGLIGLAGLCAWRNDDSELPNIEMILGSGSGAGQVITSANWYRLPPTHPDPCGNGMPWINNFSDLLLGAGWTGKRRWVQTVTERYAFRLHTDGGEDEVRRVTQRRGSSFDIEAAEADGWADSLLPININQDSIATSPGSPGFGPPGDRHNEPRRIAGIRCQLETARTELISAHRRTAVSWDVPTPEAMGVDLVHTLLLKDQGVQAQGKCRRIRHVLDLDSGNANTTLSIAVRRMGAGSNQPLTIPPRLGAADGGGGGGGAAPSNDLPTQLGGKFTSEPYDDDLLGFAGNYSIPQDPSLEQFPRRMTVEADEIPAADTDERVYEGTFTYHVGIPDDLLVM
ncbi:MULTISPECIES: hypothetical protein [unclassified Pseudomonas]|uniref:hypothetical protein n=1 Tax=unclassified Pseudomonas TaxID=196821 RepID=UPI002446F19B|nr:MULTISPECIES: hypothetical protein [unclassified Pseudomonas]MDG9928539.1 hypothetical protein [Pseudomonas sp. GD04042]MDH0482709.1 hypothetical protein [Pseudomonas sp. GD04015]MDH0604589.1 hypothetical protein [Pseudomonas sp. GD03869]